MYHRCFLRAHGNASCRVSCFCQSKQTPSVDIIVLPLALLLQNTLLTCPARKAHEIFCCGVKSPGAGC